MFGESFNFFDPPTTKRWSFNFFAKLSGNDILIANFSKLRKYQTLVLIGLHNLSKSQLADRIFKLWKSCVYDYRAVEHTTLKFWFFKFFNFRTTCQKFYEKTSRFQNIFILKVLIEIYRFTSIYDRKFLENETTALCIFFEISTEELFAS